MSNKPQRADFMTGMHQESMKGLPRTHETCIEKTGVARPGKTACDKARGAWASKSERRQRHLARDPNHK